MSAVERRVDGKHFAGKAKFQITIGEFSRIGGKGTARRVTFDVVRVRRRRRRLLMMRIRLWRSRRLVSELLRLWRWRSRRLWMVMLRRRQPV